MTPTESDIRERIALRREAKLHYATLHMLIECQQWAGAIDLCDTLRFTLRQLELLDLQRTQESTPTPPTQGWVDQFSQKIGGLVQ